MKFMRSCVMEEKEKINRPQEQKKSLGYELMSTLDSHLKRNPDLQRSALSRRPMRSDGVAVGFCFPSFSCGLLWLQDVSSCPSMY